MAEPIHVAIRFPHRISVEHTMNHNTVQFETRLHFVGSDGSRLTAVLSEEQVSALMGLRSTDPEQMARDLYIAGHIEVEEFERRLDSAENRGTDLP